MMKIPKRWFYIPAEPALGTELVDAEGHHWVNEGVKPGWAMWMCTTKPERLPSSWTRLLSHYGPLVEFR